MKIICIGRNYVEHAKEMKSDVPTEPVYLMKLIMYAYDISQTIIQKVMRQELISE